METFKGPDGNSYALGHLDGFETLVNIKVNQISYDVPLWVTFHNHCYTREFLEGDHAGWLFPEAGNRLFCLERWAFSHGLPALLKNMVPHGSCYRTTDKGQYFRIERSASRTAGPWEGWYIFFRFSPNTLKPGIGMSVRSVHPRTTSPSNDRGGQSMRFGAALAEYLRSRPEVLKSLETGK